MKGFKVTYEFCYPESNNDIRYAYVLAEDFKDAQLKVERAMKGYCESASVEAIELLDGKIIV